MTREQTYIGLASILSTAYDMEPGAIRTGTAYAAMMAGGYSLGDFLALQTMLVSAKLATVQGHALSLTDAGREKARELAALVEGKD